MNCFYVLATTSLLAIAAHAGPIAPAITITPAATIINLNATVSQSANHNTLAPSFYQTIQMATGTYIVTAISGTYDSWTQTSPTSNPTWEERIGIDQGNQATFSNANGNNVYTYPNTDPQAFSGLYANDAAALAAAQPYTLVVTSAGPVTFYIPDQSYGTPGNGFTDNSGGVSISVAPAPTPEPSSLVLLGTGALGVAGAVRRRFVS